MKGLEAIVETMAQSEAGHALFAASVCGARFFGLLTTFTVATWLGISGILRVAISFGLGLGAAAASGYAPPPEGLSLSQFVVILFQEVAAGSLFGVILSAPFWIAQGAGDILDSVRGASASNTLDPMNAVEVTVFGQFATLIAMAWFTSSGAFLLIWGVVADSFTVLPAGQISWSWIRGAAPEIVTLLSQMCLLMVVVSGPLLILMLACDVVTGLVTKAARQFSINEVSATLKCCVALFFLPVYMILLALYSESGSRDVFAALHQLMGAPR